MEDTNFLNFALRARGLGHEQQSSSGKGIKGL